LRNSESETTVVVPVVVWPVIVGIEPTTIVVPVGIEQVRIAVEMYKMTPIPPPLEAFAISELNRIRHHNALAFCTKYLQFFEVSTRTTLSKAVTVDILDAWILGSVAGSRNRPHIHLLPTISINDFI
jgi:hypothetical protein